MAGCWRSHASRCWNRMSVSTPACPPDRIDSSGHATSTPPRWRCCSRSRGTPSPWSVGFSMALPSPATRQSSLIPSMPASRTPIWSSSPNRAPARATSPSCWRCAVCWRARVPGHRSRRRVPDAGTAVGGRSIRLASSSEQRLNPFDLPPVSDDERVDPLAEQVAALIGLLEVMLAEPRQGLSTQERAVLDHACYQTYASAGITADLPATRGRPRSCAISSTHWLRDRGIRLRPAWPLGCVAMLRDRLPASSMANQRRP